MKKWTLPKGILVGTRKEEVRREVLPGEVGAPMASAAKADIVANADTHPLLAFHVPMMHLAGAVLEQPIESE